MTTTKTMFSLLPFSLLVLLIATLSTSQTLENLVVNGGFEGGSEGVPWAIPSNNNISTSSSQYPAPEGEHWAAMWANSSTTQAISGAVAGQQYNLTYLAYCTQACTGVMQVSFGSSTFEDSIPDNFGSKVFAPFSHIMTADGTNPSLAFTMTGPLDFVAYVDTISLTPLVASSATRTTPPVAPIAGNLLTNGGFEADNSSLTGWINTGPFVKCGGVTSPGVPGLAKEGRNYAYMYPGCSLIQTTNAVAGDIYEFTYWAACSNDGTDGACNSTSNINIQFGDQESLKDTLGLSVGVGSGNFIAASNFQPFSHRVTCSGSDKLSITPTNGNFHFDNITLILLGASTPSPSPSKSPSWKKSSPVGAIVGGVVGGILVFLALIAGFWFGKRRQSHRAPSANEKYTGGLVAGNETNRQWDDASPHTTLSQNHSFPPPIMEKFPLPTRNNGVPEIQEYRSQSVVPHLHNGQAEGEGPDQYEDYRR